MTVLLAWIDEFGGWLCADSAATHQGRPRHSLTSFGELQTIDHATVEEAAIKISHLPSDVIAAACGDSRSAEKFLDLTRRELIDNGAENLITILKDLTIVSDSWEPFVLFFMQMTSDNDYQLIGFDSRLGPSEPILNHRSTARDGSIEQMYYTTGSLKSSLSKQLVYAIGHIRKFPCTPELRQMIAAVYMQSMGIAEFLPSQGIGGAFWSARLSHGECYWQSDITYIIYTPGSFVPAPNDNSSASAIYQTASADMVRCLIRDGIGFVISSVERKSLALIPLGCT